MSIDSGVGDDELSMNALTARPEVRGAYVVHGTCVVRYDNELTKDDHRHLGSKERTYVFTNPEQLLADFQKDIARWNRENSDS